MKNLSSCKIVLIVIWTLLNFTKHKIPTLDVGCRPLLILVKTQGVETGVVPGRVLTLQIAQRCNEIGMKYDAVVLWQGLCFDEVVGKLKLNIALSRISF